jgi:hypothetical protein
MLNTALFPKKPVARLMELSADEIVRLQKDSWDKARWDEEARKREGVAIRAAKIAEKMRKKGSLPTPLLN